MRLCSTCNKPDAPYFEQAPCSCGAPVHDDDPQPEKHKPNCKSIGHEVVLWPVRLAVSELTYDAAGNPHALRWEAKGWKLVRDGMKFYRTKMLCRACCLAEEEKQANRREYEKLCKAARGESEQTYAQMLASQ